MLNSHCLKNDQIQLFENIQKVKIDLLIFQVSLPPSHPPIKDNRFHFISFISRQFSLVDRLPLCPQVANYARRSLTDR